MTTTCSPEGLSRGQLDGPPHVAPEALRGRPGGHLSPAAQAGRVVPIRVDAGKEAAAESGRWPGGIVGIGVAHRAVAEPSPEKPFAHPGGLVATEGELVVDGGVEAVADMGPVVRLAERRHQVEAAQPGIVGHLLPAVDESGRLREMTGLVDEHERPAGDPDVAGVLECRPEVGEVLDVVFGPRIGLLDQDPIGRPVPDPRPALIGPRHAEGEVRCARGHHLVERSLEELVTGEPVVPIAEAGHPVSPGQVGLRLADFGHPQVVEAEIGRQVGLDVTAEEGHRLGDVGPFGEPAPPPPVVLGDRVELGEVEGQNVHRRSCYRRPPVRPR